MNEYRHHVSVFFASREEAECALSELVAQGLPRERLHLAAADSGAPVPAPQADSKEVLKDVLVGGAMLGWGASVGGLIGAAAGEYKDVGTV